MPGTLLTYSGLQVKAKFKNVKAQYMKKLKSIERSGANPSTLHDWTYYLYLEPYFRGNNQVTPDHEECSQDVSSQQFRFPRKRSTTTTSETESGRDKRMKLLLTQLERTNYGVMEQLLQLRTLQFQFQQTQASAHQQHHPGTTASLQSTSPLGTLPVTPLLPLNSSIPTERAHRHQGLQT